MDIKSTNKEITIVATIGPSCNSKDHFISLKNAGVNIFRVNMSHSSLDDLIKYSKIGRANNITIGLDTEGAQIRTLLKSGNYISFKKGELFKISNTVKDTNSSKLALYPLNIINQLKVDSLIRLDFNGVTVKVEENNGDYLVCKCMTSGIVGNNKGVDVLNKDIQLPDFTTKDIQSLKMINELGISNVFISFCKSKEAILKVKEISPNVKVISKIESKSSIHNLHSICQVTDSLLIDRGDLTREINILDIPFAQRGIIKVANSYDKPCFVATNIFESLITGDLPTRAELNDIVGTIEMGAAGIVLAAETAIGKKPLLSVEIVKELIHRYKLFNDGLLFSDLERNEITDSGMKVWLNR